MIALFAFFLKRLGLGNVRSYTLGKRSRLSLQEVASIDARHKLVLVRRDNRDHLILLGNTTDTLIESSIPVTEDDELMPCFSAICGSLDFGQGGQATGRIVQLIALLTVITLAPSILVMMTSFVRIVIVLSLLRTALGTQGTPPNTVIVSLALFMTFFIMQPTLQQIWDNGVAPLISESITEEQAFERSIEPIHAFMIRHVRDKDLDLFMQMANAPKVAQAKETPLRALIPAYMISELRRAFEIGFLIFVPFLIIDMVVASV